MTSTLVFLSVTLAVAWCIAPRFFRFCDTTVSRRRLQPVSHQDNQGAPRSATGYQSTKSHQSAATYQFLSARHFNELARLTRAHVPLRDAIHMINTDSPLARWHQFAHAVITQSSLNNVLEDFSEHFHDDVSFHLLLASISNGAFVPAALDQAARSLRDQQRVLGEIEASAAQARLTMKVLTRTPVILLLALVLVSESFRNVIASPGVLFVIVVALVLNHAATLWATYLVRRISKRSSIDEILDLVTVLSVHVRAGLSLPSACLHLFAVNQLGDLIAQALHEGRAFDEAMQPLLNHQNRFGYDIATLLISAYRDGQPAVDIIGIVSEEGRQVRDQQTQICIRKLPTQLSAPVVLCALPAFMLLVVVPMFLSQLSALSNSLQVGPS